MIESPREIRTEHLVLTPVAPRYALQLYPLMRDLELTRYLAWEPHRSAEETKALLAALQAAAQEDKGYHWIIFEQGKARGIVSLIDVRRRHRAWTLERAEVAYWVTPAAQGRGIAIEATAAAISEAFAVLGLNRLIISHTTANLASGRIPQKLGFRFIGTEHEFFMKNGVWHDMNHYELLAKEWHGSV